VSAVDQRITRMIDRDCLLPIPFTRYQHETAAENWGGGYLAGVKAANSVESYATGMLTVLEISGYDSHQPWVRERVADCRDANLLTLWISQIPTSERLDGLTGFLPEDFAINR
jgi:hypothetical protein